jgi:hypothetical protein
MKVIFKETIVGDGFAHYAGSEAELSSDEAAQWIAAGFAEPIAEPASAIKKTSSSKAKKETR